jgi:thiamine-monophosphate kinase
MRYGAKKDFLVAYSGDLGDSKKDLNRLFKNLSIKKNSKFITPKLKPRFIKDISKYISTCTDISDGLDIELGRFSEANRLGIEFSQKFTKDMMCSGEEYEVLFSFDKKYLSIIKSIASKQKITLNIVGKTIRGKYLSKCQNHHN